MSAAIQRAASLYSTKASSSTADPSFNTGGSALVKGTQWTGGTHGAPVPTFAPSYGTSPTWDTTPGATNDAWYAWQQKVVDSRPIPKWNNADGADNTPFETYQKAVFELSMREPRAQDEAYRVAHLATTPTGQTVSVAPGTAVHDYGTDMPTAYADVLAPPKAAPPEAAPPAPYTSPAQREAAAGPSPLVVVGGIGIAAFAAWWFLR